MRSVVRSGAVSAAAAAASIAPYIVGTPSKTVTLSRAMTSSALAGSKRGIIVSAAPAWKAVFMPQVMPKTWKSGRQPMTTSSPSRWMSVSVVASWLVWRLSHVSSAPLGRPVVPEV